MRRHCLALWLAAAPIFAQAGDVAAVDSALAAASQAGVGYNLPRRPLPHCDGPLVAAPHLGAWKEAELRCAVPSWMRVIRLDGGRELNSEPRRTDAAPAHLAVVTVHPVAKGSIIGPDDIALLPVADQVAADALADLSLAIGRTTRTAIGADQALQARHLQPAFAVHASQPVRLQLVAGRITILLTAVPLENGELGQIIRLRQTDSGQELRGRVIGPDFVQIEANTG